MFQVTIDANWLVDYVMQIKKGITTNEGYISNYCKCDYNIMLI